ncbi:hypothetical protein KZC56_15140 [Microbacterium sp. SSW1-47]|uniref:hypothetical protein n=1 Tax=Microbacterium sufflavum TaxID=2851649 RepID=UPI001FFD1980|nr:hypothetical protein [Microbacterium sufflavum]MCK2027636.1 hypothetical protein [Microbacterium sufflavum]
MTARTRGCDVGAWVPGVTLRVLTVALVLLGVLVLHPTPFWRGVAVVAALVGAVLPRSLATWVGAACLPFGLLLSEPAPERTAVALVLVHAIHILAALSLTVPAAARLTLRSLRPTAVRFVVIQLVAQSIALGVWAVSPGQVERGAAWLAPAAASLLLVVVVVAWLVLRRGNGPVPRAVAAPSTGGDRP